jgi:hypothetical protein
MVELFEASIIKFIKDKFLESFGINVSFKFSPTMDFIEEYRKDRFSKINNSKTTDFIQELLGENVNDINLAIWNRTPIKKLKQEENGIIPPNFTPFDKLIIKTKNGIELRDIFYGKTDFNIKFFSSEAKIIRMVELIYNSKFFDVNPPIKITYSLDGEPLDIDYNTFFNEIDNIEYIDISSYGAISLIEFTFSIYGIFFSPFYTLEKLNTIKEIDLRVFALEKELDVNIIKTYNLENYPLEQLICSETCQVDQNTHLIDEKTCKSLNQDILNN